MGLNLFRARPLSGRLALALCGLAALGAAPASAQGSPGLGQSFTGLQVKGDQPISIESNQLDVDDGKAMATFTGDVTVQQGPTELKTGKLVVTYKRGANRAEGQAAPAAGTPGALPGGSDQIDRLEATEKVYVRSADQIATAQQATFDMKTQLVTMTGDVVLTQGKNVAQGCRLTIKMDSGVARLENRNCPGGTKPAAGGRVRLMLTPGADQAN